MEVTKLIQKAGGPAAVGRIVKRDHSTVCGWTRVPSEHVRVLALATGIPRHEIRPDLYEPPEGNYSC